MSQRNESQRSERWPALLSRAEAADYLGVSETTIAKLKAAEELRSVVLRSLIKYRRTDLDRFIDDLPYGDGECAANQARIVREQARRERRALQRQQKQQETRATA